MIPRYEYGCRTEDGTGEVLGFKDTKHEAFGAVLHVEQAYVFDRMARRGASCLWQRTPGGWVVVRKSSTAESNGRE